MSTTKGTRPIDANNLARRIREYMDNFPKATTRLATCRAILSMLGDETQTPTLRPVTREQVEKAWRGEWECDGNNCTCKHCGSISDYDENFCPVCGMAMCNEAVDIVMERLEALKDAD